MRLAKSGGVYGAKEVSQVLRVAFAEIGLDFNSDFSFIFGLVLCVERSNLTFPNELGRAKASAPKRRTPLFLWVCKRYFFHLLPRRPADGFTMLSLDTAVSSSLAFPVWASTA